MEKSLEALLSGIDDEVAIMANASAFIYEFVNDINWVGFYVIKNDRLVLGPFQGRSACVYINLGKGACGSAAQNREIVVLEDVRTVENYIACHEETRSEVVIPIIINNKVYGVLDIDSTTVNRFDINTIDLLKKITHVIENSLSNSINN